MKYYDVFVYGTLRKGGTNHHYLKGVPCLQENVWVSGYCLFDYQHWYPFMLETSADEGVKGEVYQVDHATLELLNMLEDVENQLYRLAFLHDLQLYTYLKYDRNVENMPKIEGGDWITYIQNVS